MDIETLPESPDYLKVQINHVKNAVRPSSLSPAMIGEILEGLFNRTSSGSSGGSCDCESATTNEIMVKLVSHGFPVDFPNMPTS